MRRKETNFAFYEKRYLFMNFQKFCGHYEHIQSPPTPSLKILFDPLKMLQKGRKRWGKYSWPKCWVGRSVRV
jgi:hypothetical protein